MVQNNQNNFDEKYDENIDDEIDDEEFDDEEIDEEEIDEEEIDEEELEDLEDLEDIDEDEIEELTDEDLAELDDDDLGDIDIDAISSGLSQAASSRRIVQDDNVSKSIATKKIEDKSSEKKNKEPSKKTDSVKEKTSESPNKESSDTKKTATKQITLDTVLNNFKPDPEKYIIPKDLCWHVKRTKTGLTIPKEIRELIPDEQNFSMVVKDNQIIFYYINEEDIPKLNLLKKPSSAPEKKGKGGRKKRSIKKKPVGPQPEWGNYFLFEFENQEKIQEVLSTAFSKYASNPPDIDEAMKRVKFALSNFMTNKRMNDFRVRQAIIFFLCDIVIKFNQPDLIDFMLEKIQPDIKSKFLKQLCLNELIYTSFFVKNYEKSEELIAEVLEAISNTSEDYAIMDSFKNLVVRITRNLDFTIPQEYTASIRDSLIAYYDKLSDFDYKIQISENLQRLQYIDDAREIAKKLKASLPEDSTSNEAIDDLIKSLKVKKASDEEDEEDAEEEVKVESDDEDEDE